MSQITITLIVLAAAAVVVVVFIWNRLPPGLVAIGVASSLYFTGVLSVEQALAGFGDPVIIYIAALFVVSEGLDATGVTAWAGQQVTGRAGSSPEAHDSARWAAPVASSVAGEVLDGAAQADPCSADVV